MPPKNGDGRLKSICVDKKADKTNILIENNIDVIRTLAVLEVMITLYPRVVVAIKWLRELEKDYETMTWLCCVVEKMPGH